MVGFELDTGYFEDMEGLLSFRLYSMSTKKMVLVLGFYGLDFVRINFNILGEL